MDRATLESRIHALLVDVLMLEDNVALTPETHIVNDLGAESINIAEITVALENEFDLAIEDERMRELATIGALTDFVAAEVAKG